MLLLTIIWAVFLLTFVSTHIVNPSEGRESLISQHHTKHHQRNHNYNHQSQHSSQGNFNHDTDEWANVLRSVANERSPASSKCVNIPKNFSLCYGIQYNSMRLPNLLEHETLEEAIQQSDAWNSLLRLHCHPDTKLFLCSLFAPICLPNLEKHIQPCQSLCTTVQKGCESRMAQYGFPWPEMLRCRFPPDNDMCIKPVSEYSKIGKKKVSKSCSQIATFENLMDNYCRSNVVLKARLKYANATHITFVKTRTFKDNIAKGIHNTASKLELSIRLSNFTEFKCVSTASSNQGSIHSVKELRPNSNILIMYNGKTVNNKPKKIQEKRPDHVAQLVLLWRPHDKNFKRTIHKFRKVNCNTLGREIRERVLRRRQTFKRIVY